MSKIITINPELLKTKTKKISPKLINKTLINRIKEKKKVKIHRVKEPVPEKNKFDESNNFLSNILQKSKTFKIHKPLNNYSQPPINKSVENLLFKPDSELTYKIDNEKPFGNLKKGLKPTLKNWKLGKKITFPTHIKDVKYSEEEEEKRILESELNKEINGKTEFSTDLLATFQNEEKLVISDEDVRIEPEMIGLQVCLNPVELPSIDLNPIDLPINLQPINLQPINLQPELQPINLQPESKPESLDEIKFDKPFEIKLDLKPEKPTEPKIQIKPNLEPEEEIVNVNQTIKRRYIIGKKGGQVGMIVSNKKTRKDISDRIKELRNTPIDKMKEALKKDMLIQVGSSAPNEVVRKIYEYSRLAGEVQNENKEVLMNNLLNDN